MMMMIVMSMTWSRPRQLPVTILCHGAVLRSSLSSELLLPPSHHCFYHYCYHHSYYCLLLLLLCLSSLSVSLLSLSLLFIIAAWSSLWSIIILMMITIHGDIDDNDEDFNDYLCEPAAWREPACLPLGRPTHSSCRQKNIDRASKLFFPSRQILIELLDYSSCQTNIEKASE